MSRGLARNALAALIALLLLAASTVSEGAPTQVRIAVGTSILNVSYAMLTLPGPLGYWKEEGLDVELLPAGASLQALQQMVAGNVEFAQINASVVLQANAKNGLPVRVAMANGVIDWSVAVPEGGPIHSIADLKGKTLGVFSLATGGINYFNSLLRRNGIDPRDVKLVPLGLGAAPIQALKRGDVQGLLYWAAAVAGFENAGLKLHRLVGEDWHSYPDFSLAVMQGTLDKDPKTVIGVSRAIAKATVFALANPDCARRIQWKAYPAMKPSGTDEATLIRWDLNNEQAQLDTLKAGFELNGGKVWGHVDPGAFDRLSAFMVQAKLIDKPVAGSSLIAPALEAQINRFDRAAIEASARACKF
jgi:NitT/TauT family transport system substrate-binding protein